MKRRMLEAPLENDREMLRRLSGAVPTDDLIAMLIDLAGRLEKEGKLVSAKVASVAANRLDSLAHPAH